jgi:branched-chain amino acid transport system ATP-binding protein
VRDIYQIIQTINREEGTTILLVEQNARTALNAAHRAYVIEVGQIAVQGTGDELARNESIRKSYLGY